MRSSTWSPFWFPRNASWAVAVTAADGPSVSTFVNGPPVVATPMYSLFAVAPEPCARSTIPPPP